ncbi:MAG TPA: choline/ethanolamine kinase family protein [Povalibacter sp.]|uniref:choline/ethanolamine kinase family protein n=1 Tax=Povalibacter sp. TaxID=1962978 RepID=UPI002C06DF76|nr:choline/ethanolamine kinase family protein [Povalibacter sp.]HMN45138.1 choline/ethanolamine kinase family protein [Povalibacter sp.]
MSQPDLRDALSGIDLGRIDSVERIKHGLTNDSWLVSSEAGVFVVRRSNASEESLQINRRSEARILEAVARAGIGPEVICCDPDRHLLVTRYAGATWTDAQATDSANIDRVALLLRRLHGLLPPRGIQSVDLANVIRGYAQTLERHGRPTDASLRQRAGQITAFLAAEPEPRLCHNDIHALNIVDDGALRLIDWEYAGVGERLFDLAAICVYHRYSKAQREHLLGGYLVEPSPQAWHRLELCCWLFDYIRELWMAVRETED